MNLRRSGERLPSIPGKKGNEHVLVRSLARLDFATVASVCEGELVSFRFLLIIERSAGQHVERYHVDWR